MRKVLKIAGNELGALFYSPVAWFILVIFTIQTGLTYMDLFKSCVTSQFLNDAPGEGSLTGVILVSLSGLFIVVQQYLYLYIPLLTMSLMSREYSSGSIKLLYSSPVTATQIISGKFLSMMFYGLVLVGVLLVYILFSCFTIPHFDLSMALSGLLGLYLLICAYAAIGLYMSSLTSYQIVAAMGTLAVLIVLNFIGNVGQDIGFVREITYWLSIKGRAMVFVNGLICSEDLFYFILVILFFLALSIMKVESHRAKRSLAASAGRYVAVIVVVVGLGYLTSRPTLQLYKDMTACQTETVTKSTQEILDQIDGEIKITTYVNLLGTNYIYGLPRAEKADMDRFKPYMRFKPDIEMSYVRYYLQTAPLNNKRFAGLDEHGVAEEYAKMAKVSLKGFISSEEINKQIDLRPEGYRFVRLLEAANGRKTFLRMYNDQLQFPTEAEVAAALKRLAIDAPKVACLTGHGERSTSGFGDPDYYSFASNQTFRYALVNQGFDVHVYRMKEGEEIPSEYDILVIADMKSPFTPDELSKIGRYIERGGNLLIAVEPDRVELTHPLLSLFGVRSVPGILVQPTSDFNADLLQCQVTEEAAGISREYARMRKRGECVTMPGAVGLEYDNTTGYTFLPILRTVGKGSWNELETVDLINERVVLNPSAGEVEGSYVTALGLSRKMGDKEQRVIVLGDADCASNAELMMMRKGINASNYSLITESFRWLTNGEFPVEIVRADPKDTTVVFPITGIFWVKFFLLGLFPLLLIGCGIFINYLRKRG
ncbi:Gldg family protein [uncultured Sanguibacteroides sp.]|uniref:Gldg family protein n=1 Tax=uncultured Sanguibacteroides sp. TaxID=1635151 RepID=UPI0025D16F1D|nr:Gldg family protein [uncultured Sanguibacteroides sp.]